MHTELLLSLALGIALSAACGFRIFVPFLVLSLAAHSGQVTLSESFSWVGSTPAVVLFAAATACEIAAYYIPWVDNALDTVASPAAVVAGIVLTASVVADVQPLVRWSLALIAGGGAAGTVQAATVSARSVSSIATAGFGNVAVSTAEAGGSLLTSLLAIFWPLLAVGLVALFVALLVRRHLGPLRGRGVPSRG